MKDEIMLWLINRKINKNLQTLKAGPYIPYKTTLIQTKIINLVRARNLLLKK
jgi:hypothetical protein